MNSIYTASYTTQTNQDYRGNPLIEALPPLFNDQDWEDGLQNLFAATDEQRAWDKESRRGRVRALSRLHVPLRRDISLAHSLMSMIREGYIGRAPQTAEDVRVRQEIYRSQKDGKAYVLSFETTPPQKCAALIGPPGMGKTTTLQRILSTLPPVIYHEVPDIYQVPIVSVECVHKGISVKDLCLSILRKIDELMPNANCFQRVANGRASAETLLNCVARELRNHYVGMLVVDEIQNLANDRTHRADLMSFLVSASNSLGVPLLLIGTNQAEPLLQTDMRVARRFVEHDIPCWSRLMPQHQVDSDWRLLLDVMWEHQWLSTYAPPTTEFDELLFELSQGIPDVLIKLFVAAQLRAIEDGSEQLTPGLFLDVARHEMARVKPMLDAIRSGSIQEQLKYPDLAPTMRELLLGSDARAAAVTMPLAGISLDDERFEDTVSASLANIGVPPILAAEISKEVAHKGTAQNALEGTHQALSIVCPTRKKRMKPMQAQYCEGDFRVYLQRAQLQNTSVYEVMKEAGSITPLVDILGF